MEAVSEGEEVGISAETSWECKAFHCTTIITPLDWRAFPSITKEGKYEGVSEGGERERERRKGEKR